MRNIPFNKSFKTGSEVSNITKAIENNNLAGNGIFSKKCEKLLSKKLNVNYIKLTNSATASLEIASILLNLTANDEVIVPSFTFVSTINSFVLRGAVPKFIDIKESDLNIDEKKIEDSITSKTKAIFIVHYAGVACNMDSIIRVARKYNLYVVEDAAQALGAKYKDKYLGTIGDIGVISFHATKNISCGEGGALILRNKKLYDRANIIIEKGTNREKFINGEVDKYTWVDIGSSYVLSELNAAYLYAQLHDMDLINAQRLKIWHNYYNKLSALENQKRIKLAKLPNYSKPNGHIFYILLVDHNRRDHFIKYLSSNGINAVSHYTALHLSNFSKKKKYKVCGSIKVTEKIVDSIVRLPLWPGIEDDLDYIVEKINKYFSLN